MLTNNKWLMGVVTAVVVLGVGIFLGVKFAPRSEAPAVPLVANTTNPAPATPGQTVTTPPPAPSPTPVAQVPPKPNLVSKVSIALLDPGSKYPANKILGCDNVVLVERDIAPTMIPLTQALKELLAFKDIWSDSGKLYNYIAQGTLSLDHVDLVNGVATVYLTGDIPTLGGVCDNPRLKIQIEETALQFPTVTSVNIFVNGDHYAPSNERG